RLGWRGQAGAFLRSTDGRRRECGFGGFVVSLRRAFDRGGEELFAQSWSGSAMSFDPKRVKFDEHGLVPAIVQDARTREVLTLAYMNEESLARTIETGQTWFWSRSRNELWHKGETSGNTQQVVSLASDCDNDAIVVLVDPAGPACHTGARSCFELEATSQHSGGLLHELYEVIKSRQRDRPEGSYTSYLFDKGLDKIL